MPVLGLLGSHRRRLSKVAVGEETEGNDCDGRSEEPREHGSAQVVRLRRIASTALAEPLKPASADSSHRCCHQ